ncbi:MAG: hypothetical protein WD512_15545 [Candidatus Paceibacterota bacterium]
MKNILFYSVALFLFLTSCSDFDDNLVRANPEELLTKNSDLVKLMGKVVNEESENPMEPITCVRFVYPLSIYLYSGDYFQTGVQTFLNRQGFSSFLETLPESQLISISYPLEIVFDDETSLFINNNQDLLASINTCSQEDIIEYGSSIFSSGEDGNNIDCVWRVPYVENSDNKYASTTFYVSSDYEIKLYYYSDELTGNWAFLYLGSDLYLNINIEGNNSISSDWNHNYKVLYIEEQKIHLQFQSEERVLSRQCESTIEYQIGQSGPSGGIVAYDKGIYSEGWRYIEIALQDAINEEWGCLSLGIENAQNTALGSGMQNTAAITYNHDLLTNYYTNPQVCNNLNNGSLASKSALLFQVNQVKDWFLPSSLDLQNIYQNLIPLNLGNFQNTYYWTSSQASVSQAQCVNFANGEVVNLDKNTPLIKSRVVRYF